MKSFTFLATAALQKDHTMATTDFTMFQQMLEQKNKKAFAQTDGPVWFKPQAGQAHTLRFLPLKSKDLKFPVEVYYYHAVTFPDGRFDSIACPQKAGLGDCPFCKHATATYKKFLNTENEDYKEAFRQLVVKTNYLLVGYETEKLDPTNLKSSDVKIVRASSNASKELIENFLAKGKDFIDFEEGRNVELLKPKSSGSISAITWSFDDPSIAFGGKNGKNTWDTLIDLSPDLTNIVTPLGEVALKVKFNLFTGGSSVTESELVATTPTKITPTKTAPVKTVKAVEEDDETDAPVNIDELKSLLDD